MRPNHHLIVVVCLAAGLAFLLPAAGHGQEAVLADLYGRGVHAYFAGQYTNAYELLTAAIDAGSRDPRAYYFRGLTYVRLGRPDEAREDFSRGAALEAGSSAGLYEVHRALERVQGPWRLELERYRSMARAQAALSGNGRRGAPPPVRAPEVLQLPPEDTSQPPALEPAQPRPIEPPMEDPLAEPAAPPDGAGEPARPAVPAAPPPAAEDPFAEEPDPFSRPAPPAAPMPDLAPDEPAAAPGAAAPSAPGGAKPPPPLTEDPFAPGGAGAAVPPAAEGAAAENERGAGRALGNALRRTLGGLLPTVPLPAVPGVGGAEPEAMELEPFGAEPGAFPGAPAVPPGPPAGTDDPFQNPFGNDPSAAPQPQPGATPGSPAPPIPPAPPPADEDPLENPFGTPEPAAPGNPLGEPEPADEAAGDPSGEPEGSPTDPGEQDENP